MTFKPVNSLANHSHSLANHSHSIANQTQSLANHIQSSHANHSQSSHAQLSSDSFYARFIVNSQIVSNVKYQWFSCYIVCKDI